MDLCGQRAALLELGGPGWPHPHVWCWLQVTRVGGDELAVSFIIQQATLDLFTSTPPPRPQMDPTRVFEVSASVMLWFGYSLGVSPRSSSVNI